MTKINEDKLISLSQLRRLIKSVDMPILEFLNIPPSPFQRPTDVRAARKAVREKLSKFHPSHLEVAIAELTEDVYDRNGKLLYKKGTRFTNNGNTRAVYWKDTLYGVLNSKNKTDMVPSFVKASIFACKNLDEVRQNYNTFDSPSSVEKDSEKIAGMLMRTYNFHAKSDFVRKGTFRSALGFACHCHDPATFVSEKDCEVGSALNMLNIYFKEIQHVDEIIAQSPKKKHKMWDAPSFCAAIMAFKKYGTNNDDLNEFFNIFSKQKEDKSDPQDRYDGATHCVIEWQDHNLFPIHHPVWDRTITIGAAEYQTGFNKTVSFMLYWIEKYIDGQRLISRGSGWDKTCFKFLDGTSTNLMDVLLDIDYVPENPEDLGDNVVKF